jgi:rhodanese-related sulfurtransferase
MKRTLLSFALASSCVPVVALACGGGQDTQAWWAPSAELREATVADLVQWAKASSAVPVDANGQQLRASDGVIPGAVLLSSTSSYDLKELPADKSLRLVFYCANERCTASHQAARRALDHGHTNVAVMAAGLKGWKAAGQPTRRPTT